MTLRQLFQFFVCNIVFYMSARGMYEESIVGWFRKDHVIDENCQAKQCRSDQPSVVEIAPSKEERSVLHEVTEKIVIV